ncbi:hypothetical protein Tco_1094093 [Tanacetum coccineum]|uniref:Uncharacterized protein n=1 Tax=Tanacetum coccineum TaxID=301880 RepID=A0ABQ5IF27_9ASTR
MMQRIVDAIKSRFSGNDESKKMQKYILKQQFEGLSVSNIEGLHKGYDRFQSLLSQLEIMARCILLSLPQLDHEGLGTDWLENDLEEMELEVESGMISIEN